MTWLEIVYVTPKLEVGAVRCGAINLDATKHGVESGGGVILDVQEVSIA